MPKISPTATTDDPVALATTMLLQRVEAQSAVMTKAADRMTQAGESMATAFTGLTTAVERLCKQLADQQAATVRVVERSALGQARLERHMAKLNGEPEPSA